MCCTVGCNLVQSLIPYNISMTASQIAVFLSLKALGASPKVIFIVLLFI